MVKSKLWAIFGILAVIAASLGNGQVEAASWPIPGPAGNIDQRISTNLRSDAYEIQNSGNYYIAFEATQYARGARAKRNEHANVIFNLGLGSESLGAGLLTTCDEIRWFVMATSWPPGEEIRLQCLRGTMEWNGTGEEDMPYKGCLGANRDIVKLRKWHGFRLKLGDGYWNTWVADKERQEFLVARLWTDAIQASVATDYLASDTSVVSGFWQNIPYYQDVNGDMQKWPSSPSSDVTKNLNLVNYSWVSGEVECPTHIGIDDRISSQGGMWYTGNRTSLLSWYSCVRDPLF